MTARTVLMSISLLTAAQAQAIADIALDTPFRDHAVLQRDRTIRVTGRAAPHESISLTFGDIRVAGQADGAGRFAIELAPMRASLQPRELAVEGPSGRAAAEDILVGEVWFCSGQSNMEWPVDGAHDAERAKSIASTMPIRSFKAPHATANRPAAAVDGSWRTATPESVGSFTAVGWWFGVSLERFFDGKVPIGIVDLSWGGTRIEPWIPLDALAKSPFGKAAEELASRIATHAADPATTSTSAGAKAPGTEPWEPASSYNGRVSPGIEFPVRGALWYQGEANAGEPASYRSLLALLIRSWRDKSGNQGMAWGVVQLAAFKPFMEDQPAQGEWALLREAQLRGSRDATGAGMISAIDLGDADDIHPRRKREVGERLAAWARHAVYGDTLVAWQGPELASAVREGATSVRVRLHHAEGLRTLGGAPGGFALAGADGRFAWAEAVITDGGKDGIVLLAPGVTDPVEVAYAWQNNPERANIVNGAGLPLVPFRERVAPAPHRP